MNVAAIRSRIARACESVRRDPGGVTLIAVSKTQPAEAIREAYDLGLRHFGESRLQEAIPKIEALPSDIVWHFIGHLQSNKAKKAAQYFDVIHTIESEGQLAEIEKAFAREMGLDAAVTDPRIDCLIEFNVSQEPQKHGIAASAVEGLAERCLHYPHVHLRGLMTIGPALEPEKMRPFFKEARHFNERIRGEWLSMGMSGDFEVAIQEGSTHIRVGTALFGERS